MCQKTVRYTNLLEIWLFLVREMFLSMIGNVSEMCQWTVFRQFFAQNVSRRCFPSSTEMSQKSVRSDISDRFLTVFNKSDWLFSDTCLKPDTFLIHFQNFSDTILTHLCKWLISDSYLTHIWLISDRLMWLIVFWHYRFPKTTGPTLIISTGTHGSIGKKHLGDHT